MSSLDLLAPALTRAALHAATAVTFLAQTTAPAVNPAGKPAPDWILGLKNFVPIAGLGLVLYFVLFGLKPKADKGRKEMLANLKRNDRVETIGGIRGTVVDVREAENDVLVKVDEGTNTKIRFARTAIREVLIDGKPADAKK